MTAPQPGSAHLEELVDEAAQAIIPTLSRLADLETRGGDEPPVCFIRECQRLGTRDATVAIFRNPEDVKLTSYQVELCQGHADRWAVRYGSGDLSFAGVPVVAYTYSVRR